MPSKRAALSYGRGDATALALGGMVIALTEHERATAFEAFEQALAISPSSFFALFFGSMTLAYAGEAERTINWAAGASDQSIRPPELSILRCSCHCAFCARPLRRAERRRRGFRFDFDGGGA
jgi:hypothetical protein